MTGGAGGARYSPASHGGGSSRINFASSIYIDPATGSPHILEHQVRASGNASLVSPCENSRTGPHAYAWRLASS